MKDKQFSLIPPTGGKAPAKQLVGRDSGDKNSEIAVAGQTMRKIPMR